MLNENMTTAQKYPMAFSFGSWEEIERMKRRSSWGTRNSRESETT